MNDDRDWRESAYLDVDNWPDAIPVMGPARENGPEAFTAPDHDEREIDDYPTHHIDAMSVGGTYGSDVCPWCGVPLSNLETVTDTDGSEGTIWDLARGDVTVPLYHPDCFRERKAVIHGHENASLEEFV